MYGFQAKPKPKHRFQDRFQDRFQQNAGRSTAFRTVSKKSSGRSTRNEWGHSLLYLALVLCHLCAPLLVALLVVRRLAVLVAVFAGGADVVAMS